MLVMSVYGVLCYLSLCNLFRGKECLCGLWWHAVTKCSVVVFTTTVSLYVIQLDHCTQFKLMAYGQH